MRPPNTVGYAGYFLRFGGTLATPQFINVGDNADMPLSDIKPTGDDVSDNINIQTLDSYGRTGDSYLWINWAGDNSDQEAWVDPDSYETVEGVTFAPGAGLWITGTSDTQSIMSSGQVSQSDIVKQLQFGGTLTGNAFPISVSLQDVLPEGDDLSDNINIQTLDGYGRTVDSYLWINWAGDNSDQEAWVDPDTYEIIEGVSFNPGAGLWITGSSNTQYIRFPAPEL